MKDIYILLLCFISGISTLIGFLFIFIPYKYKNKVLAFGFGLSFIVMFLISILDLIPYGIKLIYDDFNILFIGVFSFILLFLGMLLVKYLDDEINSEELLKIGYLSMFSLLIHNIPEGVICAMSSYTDINLGLKMIFMIMLHNIPEGICIALPIYYATKNKFKAFIFTLISGVGEVVGALITILFLKTYINDLLLFLILILTAGIMIYLSVGKIIIKGIKLKELKFLLLGVIVGFVIVILTI